jgi:hypothetical protein
MTPPVVFASIALLLLALCVVVLTAPRHDLVSISGRASSRQWSFVLFAVVSTLCGSIFTFYMLRSFGPKFGLPIFYYAGLVVGWISLLVTVWSHDRGIMAIRTPHWIAAYSLGTMMAVQMLGLVFADVNIALKIGAGAATAWYSYTLYLWSRGKNLDKRFLKYQLINVVSFFVVFFTAIIFG